MQIKTTLGVHFSLNRWPKCENKYPTLLARLWETYFADGNVSFCTFMKGNLAKAEKKIHVLFSPSNLHSRNLH